MSITVNGTTIEIEALDLSETCWGSETVYLRSNGYKASGTLSWDTGPDGEWEVTGSGDDWDDLIANENGTAVICHDDVFGNVGPVGPIGPIGPIGPTGCPACEEVAVVVNGDILEVDTLDLSVACWGSETVHLSSGGYITDGLLSYDGSEDKWQIEGGGDVWDAFIESGPSSVVICHGGGPQDGATGATGPRGDIGVTGPTGPMGPMGPRGILGSLGPRGPRGSLGPQGDSIIGPQGPPGSPGAKYAMVKSSLTEDHLGLYCTEMPEAIFEDIISLEIKGEETKVKIDPLYLDVCESGSLRVVSMVCDSPCAFGAEIKNNVLIVKVAAWGDEIPTNANIKLAGIRKGVVERFPRYSQKEASQNTKFWDSWKE